MQATSTIARAFKVRTTSGQAQELTEPHCLHFSSPAVKIIALDEVIHLLHAQISGSCTKIPRANCMPNLHGSSNQSIVYKFTSVKSR
jgi:hypothetical protein